MMYAYHTGRVPLRYCSEANFTVDQGCISIVLLFVNKVLLLLNQNILFNPACAAIYIPYMVTVNYRCLGNDNPKMKSRLCHNIFFGQINSGEGVLPDDKFWRKKIILQFLKDPQKCNFDCQTLMKCDF